MTLKMAYPYTTAKRRRENLGDIPINMVLQNLRSKLGIQDLTVKAERIRPTSAVGVPNDASSKHK